MSRKNVLKFKQWDSVMKNYNIEDNIINCSKYIIILKSYCLKINTSYIMPKKIYIK